MAMGQVAVHSELMTLPIVVSVGLSGCLVDGILFRLLMREPVGRGRMWLLFGTNLLVSLAAVGAVVALMLAHPPQIIAVVGDWRQQAVTGSRVGG